MQICTLELKYSLFLGLTKEGDFKIIIYYNFPNVAEAEKRDWKQEESWK